MNALKDQVAVMKKNPTNNPQESEPVEINERKLMDSMYAHYGKPENIVSEKLSIYRKYISPAGYVTKDWCEGGWQRGRFSVYTKSEDNSGTCLLVNNGVEKSWFFHTNGTHIKIFVGNEIDTIIEMQEHNDST